MESIKKLEDQLMVKQKKLGGEKVINEEVAASASSVIANGEVSCYRVCISYSFCFRWNIKCLYAIFLSHD